MPTGLAGALAAGLALGAPAAVGWAPGWSGLPVGCGRLEHDHAGFRQADQMGDSANILDYPKLPDRMARALLDEVRSLRRRTRKQSFPPSVQVRALDASGVPTGARSKNLLAAVRCRLDHALRVDLLVVAAAGLAQAPMAAVLVVRPGAVELTDDDLGWFRAWRIASDIVGVPAGPVWAIGRSGWLDVGANRATVLPRHRLRDRDRTGSGASTPVAADRDDAEPGDQKEDPA